MRLTWNFKKKNSIPWNWNPTEKEEKPMFNLQRGERKNFRTIDTMAWHQVLSSAFVSLSLSDLALMVPSRHSTATIVTTFCHCYFFYHCHRWIVCSLCLLTHLSNFASIIWYLLYDLQTYFLYIILNYKNFKFKQLIGDIIINL